MPRPTIVLYTHRNQIQLIAEIPDHHFRRCASARRRFPSHEDSSCTLHTIHRRKFEMLTAENCSREAECGFECLKFGGPRDVVIRCSVSQQVPGTYRHCDKTKELNSGVGNRPTPRVLGSHVGPKTRWSTCAMVAVDQGAYNIKMLHRNTSYMVIGSAFSDSASGSVSPDVALSCAAIYALNRGSGSSTSPTFRNASVYGSISTGSLV